jgi:hypothetical protein
MDKAGNQRPHNQFSNEFFSSLLSQYNDSNEYEGHGVY